MWQLPNARRPQAIGKPGEQVHGVRFIGDRACAVTFRVIDPLYVIDLAARRLSRRPLVDLTGTEPWTDLWAVRSLQFGDQLVYLARGQLAARAWASD